MARNYAALTFTDSVKSTQDAYGSRRLGEKMETMDWPDDRLSKREVDFIAQRDSFYMASVSETGWPYVQFRGGPKGFLKALDDRTLGYADFRGNQQYISTGNLKQDARVSLILMDYPNRKRLKIMARSDVIKATDRPDLISELDDPDYDALVERAVILHLEAFDWNCPQHITPRWTANELPFVHS